MEKAHAQSLCAELSSSFSEVIAVQILYFDPILYFDKPQAAWITYDMIGPDDAFGRTMTRNLQSARLNVPGFRDFPTLKHQEDRFLEVGWQFARSCTMLHAYEHMISADEKKRISSLEIFDEVEEWELIMRHYALTVASKGSILSDFIENLPT